MVGEVCLEGVYTLQRARIATKSVNTELVCTFIVHSRYKNQVQVRKEEVKVGQDQLKTIQFHI